MKNKVFSEFCYRMRKTPYDKSITLIYGKDIVRLKESKNDIDDLYIVLCGAFSILKPPFNLNKSLQLSKDTLIEAASKIKCRKIHNHENPFTTQIFNDDITVEECRTFVDWVDQLLLDAAIAYSHELISVDEYLNLVGGLINKSIYYIGHLDTKIKKGE